MENKKEIDNICEKIIGACIEVHKCLGPGLLERVYQAALAIEFSLKGIAFVREYEIAGSYKSQDIGVAYRCDFLVEGVVILELKSSEALSCSNLAQAINYVTLAKKPAGLLINFNVSRLTDGIRRIFPVAR